MDLEMGECILNFNTYILGGVCGSRIHQMIFYGKEAKLEIYIRLPFDIIRYGWINRENPFKPR